MIPYEDLCRALDQFNSRRRNAEEMAQLDQDPDQAVEAAPAPVVPVYQEAATQEEAPLQPVAYDSGPVEPVSHEAPVVAATEEPTVQAPLEMGATDQIFAPGSEMPYSPEEVTANTAETAMPYLEESTDMTPIEGVPDEIPAGPEETTQEFDIEEAEEVLDKDLGE